MADRPNPLSGRPVAAGLAALTGVAVVIGLLAGVTVLLGTKILGVGGGEAQAGDTPTAGETLFLPDPAPTTGPSGPRITLDVDPKEQAEAEAEEKEEAAEEKDEKKKEKLTLRAGQTSVSAMQRIDLSGSYKKGEGAILQVQRKENGTWADFPVTVSVRDGSFSTYVMTGQSGKTKFRVVDTDSGEKSNVVTVKIG